MLCLWVSVNSERAEVGAGLIVKGVDTTYYENPLGYGMDFVLARPCSTVGEFGCVQHFATLWGPDGCYQTYALGSGAARSKAMGKTNLDSIAAAPPDSQMEQRSTFMCPPPDSLAQYIGNVYVMRCGADPRDGVKIAAKIKVLDFAVRNAQEHQIDMVFLWAANWSGFADLATSGLDTFTLDYHVDTIPETVIASRLSVRGERLRRNAAWRVVVGEDGVLRVPGGLVPRGSCVDLFDVGGRLVATLPVGSRSSRQGARITPGVYVVGIGGHEWE